MRNYLLLAVCYLLAAILLHNRAAAQIKGPGSSQTPYILPVRAGVQTTSVLTTTDIINSYKMCGIPDGLGAFDNGDGTFTVLMTHEFGNTAGVVRAHGSKGAFVSKWIINKSNLAVISGSDLIQNVKLWNGSGYTTYNSANPYTTGFTRFCSADLPPISAFYNNATGKGTQERIFLNGEEAGNEGRSFAHIVTGPNARTSYELPWLGKFSWENAVANPYASDKTIVAGTDDATPGQVYFYIGTKTSTGTEIDKAGLNNGILYGTAVNGMLVETSASIPVPGTPFTMKNLGDVHGLTGATLNTNSNTAGVSQFLRPEDGAWDPMHPEDFYFVTTNGFNSPSRLWKLHFSDINDLTLGGVITAVLNGTEGQQMFDNMTIDHWGHIILQEDVGNNAHLGKIWQYTIATDALVQLTTHDATRFLSGGAAFLTQDEEASGIIDVQEILGAGMFLLVDQAHYPISGEAVEGGQLLTLFNPDTYNACANYTGLITVSPSPTVSGQAANTIYLGYGPQSVNLTASVPDGLPPYTYSWSPGGSTAASIVVSPVITTTYTVTIKNAFGCAVNVSQTVFVEDIRDGDKNKVFICHNGHEQSISVNAVPAHLAHGDKLGSCAEESSIITRSETKESDIIKTKPVLYPNPATNTTYISLWLEKDEQVTVSVINGEGKTLINNLKNLKAGQQVIDLNTSALGAGVYFVRLSYNGTTSNLKLMIAR